MSLVEKYFNAGKKAMFLFVVGVILFIPTQVHSSFNINSEVDDSAFSYSIFKKYVSLNTPELSFEAFATGYQGLVRLNSDFVFEKDSILTIVDFSRSSVEKRFFVIDIKNDQVLYKSLVAHGKNSGGMYAGSFSNVVNSLQSSLGFYATDHSYNGRHGYSLVLNGLQEGINDNARERAIVIHGADYVSEDYIRKYGRLGRSFGCPALSYEISSEVIDLIKDGSCLFLYHPSKATNLLLALN